MWQMSVIYDQLQVILQIEICDSNSRSLADEDFNGKFMLERAIEYSIVGRRWSVVIEQC